MSRILRDFTLMYLFGVVVVAVIMGLILMFFPNYSDSSNIMGVLVPMVAAMQVGQFYHKRTGTALSGGLAWKAALACTVISVVISLTILWLRLASGVDAELSALAAEMRQPGNMQAMVSVVAGLSLLLMLVIRGGFAIGGRTQAKANKQLAEKAAKQQARNG